MSQPKGTMLGSLPRRYARALLETAKEEGTVGRFEEELSQLASLFSQSPSLLEALSNESFEASSRLAAVQEIAEKAAVHPLVKNFLLLLVQKKRIGILPEIAREYRRLSDEILGIVRVSVAETQAPEPSLLNRVEKIVAGKLKKKVITTGEARPEILGGILLKVNHTIYDGSIKRELERMKESLLRG